MGDETLIDSFINTRHDQNTVNTEKEMLIQLTKSGRRKRVDPQNPRGYSEVEGLEAQLISKPNNTGS